MIWSPAATSEPLTIVVPAGYGGEARFRKGPAYAFLSVHALLGIVVVRVPAAALIHALLTFAVMMYFAAQSNTRERVVYACAYCAGAEVLWRMAEAPIFWESAKYAIAAGMLLNLIAGPIGRFRILPLFYGLLFIPSIVSAVAAGEAETLRSDISFNLSGPLLLAVAVLFFQNVTLSPSQFRLAVLAFLGPVAGMGASVIVSIMNAESLEFTTESNRALSGGFGPNQVAAIFGLGALLAVLLLMLGWTGKRARWLFGGTAALLLAQSALTFSRGGLYSVAGTTIIAALMLYGDVQSRQRVSWLLGISAIAGVLVIGPWLNRFTEGNLGRRLSETQLTNRLDLMQDDLEVWERSPVLGVGPGMSRRWHFHGLPAHTEFTRAVAEHGLFGLAAVGVLGVLVLQRLIQGPDLANRVLVVGLVVWSCLFMVANAMRIAAPSFAFGLAFATISTPVLHGRFWLRRGA